LLLFTALGLQAEPRRSELFESHADPYVTVRERMGQGQWHEALALLTQLASRQPDVLQDAEFHNLKGYTLRQSDVRQLPLAIAHYLQALRLDPAHVEAREYLGQAYLLQGRLDLAEQQLREIEHHCKGRGCEAWQDLAQAITKAKAARKTSVTQP
jgi:Flp pilus assembly protein TadD